MKKRGQAWGLDLTVAGIIFVIGLIALYIYLINYKTSEENELKEARYQATLVSDAFLSEGDPVGWTISNVNRIGVLSNGKINETKLGYFQEISINNYNLSKNMLNTKQDYFINFSIVMSINNAQFSGIGKVPDSSAKQIYKLNRFSSYKEKPITINVISWKNE